MVLLLPALQVSAALRQREYVSTEDIELLIPHVLNHRIELAPGVSDIKKVLQENMQEPIEKLAKSTLK
jgi:MoxR-like ATPase